MSQKKDNLFASPQSVRPFQFDQAVAEVFADMINRSVPGYTQIIETIGVLARRYARANSNVYDLGCSLGAATLAVARAVDKQNVNIIGVDNSAAMIARARAKVEAYRHSNKVEFVEADIDHIQFTDASFVILNFTLQFICPQKRLPLLQRINQAMQPGDALILAEKVVSPEADCEQLMIDLHHEFKRQNGYSELEISQKRSALENVLIAESQDTHKNRLREAGFSQFECWFKLFNFAAFIAIK